jgi:hypothetical protein
MPRWEGNVLLNKRIALGLVVSIAAWGHADPIPQGRRTDWTYAGIPGGIPNRTTVCATFNPGATAAQINSALAACNNGVVLLNAGTYNITGIDLHKDNVTLRGAGADKTILKGSGGILDVGSGGNIVHGASITGGGARGATSITASSIANLSVGTMIELDRDDDPSFVVSTSGGARHIRQVNMITAINGNTITLRNPLLWDFNTGNGKIAFYFINNSGIGVEDLKLDHSAATSGSFNFQYCDRCWLKGFESYKPAGYHIIMLGTLNCEVRDSLIHDMQGAGNNNGGLAVYGNPNYGSNSHMKIENNIFDKNFPAIELQNSDAGFYVGYNYSYGSMSDPVNGGVTWTFTDNHGPHDMMNLWEGNIGEMFGSDGYFGGSSHGTALRNYFTGFNPHFNATGEPVRLGRLAYQYNLVGNVLGSTEENPAKYVQAASGCTGGDGIYMLGYPNLGNCNLVDETTHPVPGGMTYPDAKVASTLLRWGNYDYFNKATRFVASEVPSGVSVPADQIIPASYYYTSKPAWFPASMPWPPIGPDVTGGNGDTSGHVNKNPAQLCWESRNLKNGGTFSASACYSATSQPPPSACDCNSDGATNVSDVQLSVNMAITVVACTHDINNDGACNVIDVQRVVNAALGGQCVTQ